LSNVKTKLSHNLLKEYRAKLVARKYEKRGYNMLLGELLKRIEYIECLNFSECEVRGVTEYSKR